MNGKLDSPNLFKRWNGFQRRIGLTGGIATGKSTIGLFLKENKKLPLIDADELARKALQPGKASTSAVIQRYGKSIITHIDNKITINRLALSKIIYSDHNEKQWLEKLIHPIVIEEIIEELFTHKNAPIVILMIPLLFEAQLTYLCSEIWLVDCDHDEQIKRLMKRDGINKIEACKKIESQLPQLKKRELSDFIIDNNGNEKEWIQYVDHALSKA